MWLEQWERWQLYIQDSIWDRKLKTHKSKNRRSQEKKKKTYKKTTQQPPRLQQLRVELRTAGTFSEPGLLFPDESLVLRELLSLTSSPPASRPLPTFFWAILSSPWHNLSGLSDCKEQHPSPPQFLPEDFNYHYGSSHWLWLHLIFLRVTFPSASEG